MKILITGAVLGDSEKNMEFYADLIDSICFHFPDAEILSPLDTIEFTGDNNARFNLAKKSVENADIIIAEITNPSHAQGMELMLAKMLNKEVVFIYKKFTSVSELIKGCFPNALYIEHLKYLSMEQLNQIFELIENTNHNKKSI